MPPLPSSVFKNRHRFLRWGCCLLPLLAAASPVLAQSLRINELVAATNDRVLQPDEQGRLRPGTGPFWGDLSFSAPGWQTGTAPIGFGGSGIGTNVASSMQNRTPVLYTRRVFSLTESAAANEGQLVLKVRFDDGFIAWINGKEAARANAGPVGHHVYADQKAYNFATATTSTFYTPNAQPGTSPSAPTTGITYNLGRLVDWLQPGQNVLAIQLLNRDPAGNTRIDAQLESITANVTLDVVRHTFDDGNNAALIHRNLGGVITNTTEGTMPPGSWPAVAALPQSAGWTDLTLRTDLPANGGYDNTGALRYTYSQTDAVNQTASVSGPPLPLSPAVPAGGLTTPLMESLRVTFRLRATTGTAWNLRLDPDGNSPASSLTGLAAITPTAGSGATQDPADGFDDAINGVRNRTVGITGAVTNTVLPPSSLKNTLAILTGTAMRDAEFTLREDNTAGSGTGTAPGALEFNVVRAPAVPDFLGFTYQTLPIRSWSAGNITAAQLKSGAVQFDYHIPAGVSWQVFLESATGAPTAGDRLGLGTITGNGTWQTATLDTSTATNQTAFISYMNSVTSNSVKVVLMSTGPLVTGSRVILDNIGFAAWRTYNVLFSSGLNQAAFMAAINAQATPSFVPVLEKTGTAISPGRASLTMDDFAITITKQNAGTAGIIQPYSASGWTWFPGLAEPAGGVVEPADFSVPLAEPGFEDWVELFNPGATPVDLTGWSLTDSRNTPRKYNFPAGTSIAPASALVILASNRPAPAGAAYLHAPFSLSADGEYLALIDPAGAVVDALDPGFPAQTAFRSYGRHPDTQAWGYMRTATPGQPNAGTWQDGIAAEPVFSQPGGFYPTTATVSLTTSTAGAEIRYTTDSTDPTATSGIPYSTPLSLGFLTDKTGHVIKARTFAPGLVPSPVVTHTYLINQNAGLRTAPAVLLSGNPGQTFYKPAGIFSIQGGSYQSEIWTAAGPNDYNMPVGDGRLTDPDASSRPYERPAFLEYYFPDNREGIRENAGVRISSSPYSRPRLILDTAPNSVLFPATATQKPSLNIFFRNDYGAADINYPLIPETEVRTFSEFRLRAGKNDIGIPFIRDEFIRRLWTDMGHEGTVGTFASVYLNGYFKGYYNLVERIREAFMQGHHRSTASWDVNYIGVFEDGDNIHWNTVLQPRLNANLTVKANWDALKEVLDVTNVADYILINTWAAMWDWPHNNWAMARERSATGLWRCYVWDAEGGLNMGGKTATYQTLNLDLLVTTGANNNTPIPVMFRRLMTSPDFRLLFADRIQKHLFNNGALTDAKTSVRRTTTQAEVAPLMAVANQIPNADWYNNWVNTTTGRRATLLPGATNGQFRDPNQDGSLADTLWPVTLPPVFSQHGGTVAAGYSLTITHSAPAGSTLYYTLDGTDPRNWGGTVAATALTYSGPVILPGSSVTAKARVRNVNGEWSPLTEARFALATVPASAENTVIAEVMYNPPPLTTAEASAGFLDKEDFEYIVVQNIGPAPIDLSALRFQLGITYTFATTSRPVIDPGQRAVLAKNAAALRFRYGAAIDDVLAGEFFGNLSNSGDDVRLEISTNAAAIKAFSYQDSAPWPGSADGNGPSLLLVNPASNPDHTLPASWTASASPGGLPTGAPLNLTYAQWSAWTFSANQLLDPIRTGPEGDFDNDGLPNLIEFLTGSDARKTESPAPLQWSITPGAGQTQLLQLTLPRLTHLSGYQLQVQSSQDLLTWHNDFTLTTSTPQPSGTTLQTWQKTAPAGTTRHYMRLRALNIP